MKRSMFATPLLTFAVFSAAVTLPVQAQAEGTVLMGGLRKSVLMALLLWLDLGAYALAADLTPGREAIKAGRYEPAKAYLLPLVNGGDNEAQRLIGEVCFSGQGVKQDLVAAFAWNDLAANGGDQVAQYNLGHLYETGNRVALSSDKARKWYTKSALQGYVLALRKMGDHTGSLYWYDQARQRGDTISEQNYASKVSARYVAAAEESARYLAQQERENAAAREEALADQAKRDAQEAYIAAASREAEAQTPSPSTHSSSTRFSAERSGSSDYGSRSTGNTASFGSSTNSSAGGAASSDDRDGLAGTRSVNGIAETAGAQSSTGSTGASRGSSGSVSGDAGAPSRGPTIVLTRVDGQAEIDRQNKIAAAAALAQAQANAAQKVLNDAAAANQKTKDDVREAREKKRLDSLPKCVSDGHSACTMSQ